MSIIFIYPGQLVAMATPSIIRTILGSCVGVALWDPKTNVGGLCHYLLPNAPGDSGKSGRYGEFAIQELLNQCLELGARRESIEAQVYGGGAVVDSLSGGMMAIGDRNIECAMRNLKTLQIKITKESVGGKVGRRIALDTTTGNVVEELQNSSENVSRTGAQLQKPLTLTRVLIVDDSATIRNILKSIFDKSKKVSVVGTAVDPFDAREKIIALKPDVITLDIEMPRMNGITFLEKIMEHKPMPVVVVSSLSSQGAAAERALELGAIEFVHKPSQFDPRVLSDLAEQLIPKVIAAASAKVTKANPSKIHPIKSSSTAYVTSKRSKSAAVELVVIGGNAGAAEVLAKIVATLAPDTPPVVVSISTVSGFAQAWIQKQKAISKLPIDISVLSQPVSLKSGHVYIATDKHIKIQREGHSLRAVQIDAPPSCGQRPAADILIASASEVCKSSLVAILLSGYGNDGVNGLMVNREAGGWNICQNPEDCAFNFNVCAAIEEGIVDEVSFRDDISGKIYTRRSASLAS